MTTYLTSFMASNGEGKKAKRQTKFLADINNLVCSARFMTKKREKKKRL
jgi:hypothetical protein